MSEEIEYESVWDGRGPLTSDEGWIQKQSPLVVAAERNIAGDGLLSNREMKGKCTHRVGRLWRSAKTQAAGHLCSCGAGIPDVRWSEGQYRCQRCQRSDSHKKAVTKKRG